MLKKNFLKEKLELGKPCLGTWSVIPSIEVIDIIASSGFDFIILDQEHGPINFETIQNQISICENNNCSPIVRVPGVLNSDILRSLDIGAHGLQIPNVKNIEDIVVGEEVLTYNEENGVNEIGVVGDLKQHEVDSIVRITLDNEIVINTTSEHPFYVNGKGWVKAGELEVLDTCKKYNGEESLVSTVDVIEETHTVYNLLNVSENHNFYANGILVHNKL